MRLAAQYGTTLGRTKRITPYSEFLLWRAKWEKDDEDEFKKIGKLDYYLAQIAREVRVVLYKSADAKKVSLKDFILKFKFNSKLPAGKPPPKSQEEPPKANEIEKKTILSKSFWFALVGINRKDKVNGTPNSTRRTGSSSNRKR